MPPSDFDHVNRVTSADLEREVALLEVDLPAFQLLGLQLLGLELLGLERSPLGIDRKVKTMSSQRGLRAQGRFGNETKRRFHTFRGVHGHFCPVFPLHPRCS